MFAYLALASTIVLAEEEGLSQSPTAVFKKVNCQFDFSSWDCIFSQKNIILAVYAEEVRATRGRQAIARHARGSEELHGAHGRGENNPCHDGREATGRGEGL